MMIPHKLHINGAFHIDDNLYNNLIEVPKRLDKNKDAVILIVGDPGNGKSTIGATIGYLWDNDIINQSCFFSTIEDYKKYQMQLLSNNINKKRVIVHDEARETGGLNVLNKDIRKFWDLIYENRFLNMYQILIQSDFFKIPRDIIFNRALFLIWVIEDQDWSNGIYYFFSKRNLIRLYDEAKRNYNYQPRYFDFKGRFVSFWAGNPNYLNQKESNFIHKYTTTMSNNENNKYKEIVKRILTYQEITRIQKSYLLQMHKVTISRKKKEIVTSSH